MLTEEKKQALERYFAEQAAAFPGKVAYLYAEAEKEAGEAGKQGTAAIGMTAAKGAAEEEKREIFAPVVQAHAAERVVSASTIKVPIMLCLFDRMEREGIAFQQRLPVRAEQICEDSVVFEYGAREASLYELAVWMIVNSDNTATNVLMEYLGFERMNAYFASLGLTQTRAERYMLDFAAVAQGKNNYISPEDFARCMALIYGKRAEHPLMKTAWDILRKNRDHNALLRYLYEHPACAHKTGGLDDIEHDAGVFETKNGDYFLGVFVSEFAPGEETVKEAAKLIGRLSRRTYEIRNAGDAV